MSLLKVLLICNIRLHISSYPTYIMYYVLCQHDTAIETVKKKWFLEQSQTEQIHKYTAIEKGKKKWFLEQSQTEQILKYTAIEKGKKKWFLEQSQTEQIHKYTAIEKGGKK